MAANPAVTVVPAVMVVEPAMAPTTSRGAPGAVVPMPILPNPPKPLPMSMVHPPIMR